MMQPSKYIFMKYIKNSILLKISILLLWYHLRKAKEQKKKNMAQKEFKFPFLWCSLVFNLTADVRDTTIVIFIHESFPSTQYVLMYEQCLQRHGIRTKYATNVFNLHASVSINTKLYTCKIRTYDINYFSGVCLTARVGGCICTSWINFAQHYSLSCLLPVLYGPGHLYSPNWG